MLRMHLGLSATAPRVSRKTSPEYGKRRMKKSIDASLKSRYNIPERIHDQH
jgi:hypothetical protein